MKRNTKGRERGEVRKHEGKRGGRKRTERKVTWEGGR